MRRTAESLAESLELLSVMGRGRQRSYKAAYCSFGIGSCTTRQIDTIIDHFRYAVPSLQRVIPSIDIGTYAHLQSEEWLQSCPIELGVTTYETEDDPPGANYMTVKYKTLEFTLVNKPSGKPFKVEIHFKADFTTSDNVKLRLEVNDSSPSSCTSA